MIFHMLREHLKSLIIQMRIETCSERENIQLVDCLHSLTVQSKWNLDQLQQLKYQELETSEYWHWRCKMSYIKVEGHSELVREQNSHAVINTDTTTYNTYMRMMENKKKQRDQLRDAVREINSLKCEMHEIKSLLMQLMDKK